MSSNNLPEDVLDAVRLLMEAKERKYLTRTDKENINRAKLRVAYWACRSENIVASRDNLTYILGPDAAEIMDSYDKYLEREGEKIKEAQKKKDTEKKGKKGGPDFWEHA